MGVLVRVVVESGGLVERLRGLSKDDVPERRGQLVQGAARDVLLRVIGLNPVETGRSRSAWVAALEQLGGAAPEGWQGGQADARGVDEGAALGSASVRQSATETEVAATSGVEYIAYLEYGTRQMAPRGMVRRALAEASGVPRSLGLTE